jgi:hypothetical protein
MLDVKAAIERALVSPGEELRGVLVLAVVRDPKGKGIARMVAVPIEQEEMLVSAMRNYLAGPDDLRTFTRE